MSVSAASIPHVTRDHCVGPTRTIFGKFLLAHGVGARAEDEDRVQAADKSGQEEARPIGRGIVQSKIFGKRTIFCWACRRRSQKSSVPECRGGAVQLPTSHALCDVQARAGIVQPDRCKCVRMRVEDWARFISMPVLPCHTCAGGQTLVQNGAEFWSILFGHAAFLARPEILGGRGQRVCTASSLKHRSDNESQTRQRVTSKLGIRFN